MSKDQDKRIGELEDELKRAKERIGELKDEVDELRERQARLIEHIEEGSQISESWCETFGMKLTADNMWTWEPFWDEWNDIAFRFDNLARKHNSLVRDWNTHIAHAKPRRNVGRPLAASESQVRRVLKLRQGGLDWGGHANEACTLQLSGADAARLVEKYDRPPLSLREIAEETSLGLNTVRTIIAQAARKDRTTRKHLAKVEPEVFDRQRGVRWKRQRRTGNELPKRINRHLKDGADLRREAKR